MFLVTEMLHKSCITSLGVWVHPLLKVLTCGGAGQGLQADDPLSTFPHLVLCGTLIRIRLGTRSLNAYSYKPATHCGGSIRQGQLQTDAVVLESCAQMGVKSLRQTGVPRMLILFSCGVMSDLLSFLPHGPTAV